MIFASFAILAWVAAGAPPEPDYPVEFHRWGEFQAHILHGAAQKRDVTVSVTQADFRHGRYLVARKVESLFRAPQPVAWADGRTCRALATMPATMKSLGGFSIGEAAPMSRRSPDRPGMDEIVVTADGPSYSIDAPGRYAWDKDLRVRLDGGGLTPVGDWVEARLKALAACWSPRWPDPAPPERGFMSGEQIRATEKPRP